MEVELPQERATAQDNASVIRSVYVKIPRVQNHKIPGVAPPGIRSRDCPPSPLPPVLRASFYNTRDLEAKKAGELRN